MTDKLRQAIEQTVAILGPEAPLCSGCVEEWTEALRILNDALLEQPAEQEPVAHDEDLLERLYWEFDRQRKKTGEERLAFKGKMRFYASDFRRVSIGKAAFSQSVTDDMMNLADRLGSEYDDVDPKAWKHLLVYAPQSAKREPLTDENHHAFRQGVRYAGNKYEAVRGERFTGGDVSDFLQMEADELDPDDIARAIERAHGIGEQE